MTRSAFLGFLVLLLAWKATASESLAGLRAVDWRSPPADRRGTVWQSPRALPVAGRAQVLVVGGTFSGTAAAWAAARQGTQTILLAEEGFLGGLATAGLKAVFDEKGGPERRSRLLPALLTMLRPEGVVGDGCFDPEYAKWALDRLTQEAGVKVLFHSQPVGAVLRGRRVVGAVVLGPEGRQVYLADAVIDATEEAVLLASSVPPAPRPPPRPIPWAVVTFFHWSGGGERLSKRSLRWYPTPWPDEVLGRFMEITTGSSFSEGHGTRIATTARQEIDRLTSFGPPPSLLFRSLSSFPFSPSPFVSLTALRSYVPEPKRKPRRTTSLQFCPSSPGHVAEWSSLAGTESPEFVPEAGRLLPVLEKAAVVVAGDGLAATAAAIAAARGGATVLLAGPHAFLGGRATAEGVQMFMPQPSLGGLYTEFMEQLQARGARFPSSFVVDPEAVKIVLQEMALAAGVGLWLRTRPAGVLLDGRRVTGVIVEGPEGRGVFQAQVVIDATRDGDLAAAAGAPFTKGRESDGLTQPSTLMYTLLQTGPRAGPIEDLRFGYPMPRGRSVQRHIRPRHLPPEVLRTELRRRGNNCGPY